MWGDAGVILQKGEGVRGTRNSEELTQYSLSVARHFRTQSVNHKTKKRREDDGSPGRAEEGIMIYAKEGLASQATASPQDLHCLDILLV